MTPSKPYLINALYEWIADNNCTPHIIVKTDQAGVVVPQEFVQDDQIVFNISMSAVKDLAIEKTFISFSARFGGKSHDVYVPMGSITAVYAKENGQGMAFDISTETYDEPQQPAPPPKGKPSLKVVK